MAKIYTDYKHYPHGFSRSGDFTIKETERIERFGCLMKDLMTGSKTPSNDLEVSYLAQLSGKVEVTSLEVIAWNKYQNKISEPTKYFPLTSTTRETEPKAKASKAAVDDADIEDGDDEGIELEADIEGVDVEDDEDEDKVEEDAETGEPLDD